MYCVDVLNHFKQVRNLLFGEWMTGINGTEGRKMSSRVYDLVKSAIPLKKMDRRTE